MDKRSFREFKRRAPVVNGIFYPDSSEALTEKLASWALKDGSARAVKGGSRRNAAEGAQAILVPHGAWDLTGNIAGTAFAAVQEEEEKTDLFIDRVLLLGPRHNSAEDGIYLSESAFFETPSGDLPVDQELNQQLASCSPLIKVYDIPHLSEHSLEVLLPLVKYCFPAAKIVPILMAGTDPVLISGLAKALQRVFEKHLGKTLIVISSSVSHDHDPALALSMADEFRGLLADMDTGIFLAQLAAGRVSACGGALVGALLASDLFKGKYFSALGPLAQATGENGETIYYGAFACAPHGAE